MENDHIVWAYGDNSDLTGTVVICGLTAQGLQYLRDTPGQALRITPRGEGFANVTEIVVYHEQDKATLKRRVRECWLAVEEP